MIEQENKLLSSFIAGSSNTVTRVESWSRNVSVQVCCGTRADHGPTGRCRQATDASDNPSRWPSILVQLIRCICGLLLAIKSPEIMSGPDHVDSPSWNLHVLKSKKKKKSQNLFRACALALSYGVLTLLLRSI